MSEPDDQRLLSKLRSGQSDACTELVRGHYQRVYRFLVHLTRDVHQAEDLTQETFAAAWQRISSFEARSSLATWLHRIAYTKFLDAHRAERRHAGAIGRLRPKSAIAMDPGANALADEEARRLYQALDCLEDSDRTLLVLHYLQGLSYRDMAAVLDQPNGTIKWRTAEALQRLRAALTAEVPDHAP